ncbi:dihydrolipoyl dehydrogenase [Marinobacterium nitratireducens]|uniref:Dihydrolipoyl dehydrogenase n=1 Tax=Marinobacterium nitratireducens TaxID=518897 RepID=A0A917ZMI4_9GAMM|nr:dihydrolipoyl dehydrogenase [Marinobacterium nitratireducens]GGO86308.1 dihydrolipoyl dehydrogenase [Marinobacterium nitratireducens]
MNTYDLIVVGGGPGGYVAAIRASQLGMKTALVEREHLGGICLNWGCIPTKALLRSAEIIDQIRHADNYGVSVSGLEFDLKKIVSRSRGVAGTLNKGVAHLLKKNKVTVYNGHAQLKGGGKLEVDSDKGKVELASNSIVLATGARARSLPGIEPDGKLVWTYKEAMTPESLPKSLLVMGAGAIGIEFASFYNSLGVEVTVVEALDQVLPVEDAEIAALADKAFRQKGIRILTGARVTELRKGANSVVAVVESAGGREEIEVERLISAVGVVGNTENIGLENTAAEVERSFVLTDEWSQTAEPGLYAIGDVAGAPCLAHKASHEGIICVEKIAGTEGLTPLDKGAVPGCTYSSPQVASVGLTEARAQEQGYKVRVGRFPFKANGKAIALGESEGLVKTVFDDKTGELLGAHMIGPEVTEMIQGYVVARQLETTEHELMHTIFAHPTLSESMHEATLDAYGKALHI